MTITVSIKVICYWLHERFIKLASGQKYSKNKSEKDDSKDMVTDTFLSFSVSENSVVCSEGKGSKKTMRVTGKQLCNWNRLSNVQTIGISL